MSEARGSLRVTARGTGVTVYAASADADRDAAACGEAVVDIPADEIPGLVAELTRAAGEDGG